MISIILYGRNDNYGYNLHKRAALSLNCMAQVLTAPDDEILFVDYNTPDDYPTFPEAIRDTLTPRAQRLLRILRVRPAQHARFAGLTHLKALEPVARNVALRRSNPANRWVLSTNTDMIFVPRQGTSLSDIVSRLDHGFYHLPRFEIPEYLWETLDRFDAEATISAVAGWGWSLHLNEIVYGSKTILYDAPGDFQLARRDELFEMDGFDERMLLGWHVDSNIAKRLDLLHGAPGSLVSSLFGYHCDHTRQATPAHRHDRVQNDWRRFIDDLDTVDIPEQHESWGLADAAVEEISLAEGARRYLDALHHAVGAPMQDMDEISYISATYSRIGYDPRHVLPFLLDAVCAYPRDAQLVWLAADPALLARFVDAWGALGFTLPILVVIPAGPAWPVPAGCQLVDVAEAIAGADIFVFDFGGAVPAADDAPAELARARVLAAMEQNFRRMVAAEQRRLADSCPPRRVIAVNVVNNRAETVVHSYLAVTFAPIATRLRQGFVLPAVTISLDVLAGAIAGLAGQRLPDGGIVSRPGIKEVLLHGLYRDLQPGRYRVSVTVQVAPIAGTRPDTHPLRIELRAGSFCLLLGVPDSAALRGGVIEHAFEIPEDPELLVRLQPCVLVLRVDGSCEVAVSALRLASEGADPKALTPGGVHLLEPDHEWLPLQRLAAGATEIAGKGIRIRPARAGHAIFGPYVALPPGRYELQVDLVPGMAWGVGAAGEIGLEAVHEPEHMLGQLVQPLTADLRRLSVPFEVPEPPIGRDVPQAEFRLWLRGGRRQALITSVRTRRVGSVFPAGSLVDAPCCAPVDPA